MWDSRSFPFHPPYVFRLKSWRAVSPQSLDPCSEVLLILPRSCAYSLVLFSPSCSSAWNFPTLLNPVFFTPCSQSFWHRIDWHKLFSIPAGCLPIPLTLPGAMGRSCTPDFTSQSPAIQRLPYASTFFTDNLGISTILSSDLVICNNGSLKSRKHF